MHIAAQDQIQLSMAAQRTPQCGKPGLDVHDHGDLLVHDGLFRMAVLSN
jgi:hypothetical protein